MNTASKFSLARFVLVALLLLYSCLLVGCTSESEKYYKQAEIYRKQEKYDKAITAYQKAIKADSNYAPAHYELGLVYEQQGELKKAKEQYQKTIEKFQAIEIDLLSNNEKSMLAEAYYEKSYYSKAVELIPERQEYRYSYAKDLYNNRSYEKATEEFDRLAGFKDSEDYKRKCMIEIANAEYEKAVANYKSDTEDLRHYTGNFSIMMAVQDNGLNSGRERGIYVWIKNTSSRAYHVNPNDFTMVGVDNHSYHYHGGSFDAVDLQPGTKTSGALSFPTVSYPKKLICNNFRAGKISKDFPTRPIDILKNEEFPVQLRIAKLISLLGEVIDERENSVLWLREDRENRVSEVIDELEKIGEPAVSVLIKILNDKDENVSIRKEIPYILETIGRPAKTIVSALIKVVSDEAVSYAVLDALNWYDFSLLADAGEVAEDIVPVLMKILSNSEDCSVRESAIEVLGNIGKPAKAAVPILLEILKDREEETILRKSAVKALGDIGEPVDDIVPALINSSRDISWVFAVEKALVKIGKPAVPFLIKELDDKLKKAEEFAYITTPYVLFYNIVGTLEKIATPKAKKAVKKFRERTKTWD